MKSILTILVFLFAIESQAELYQWSNPSPHHAAVVQVESAGRGGSGAYVEYEGLRFILTAAHVVGGQTATVTFQNGHTATGKTRRDRNYQGNGGAHDLAAILIEPVDSVQPVQIGSYGNFREVEICGYGGPGSNFRHYLGKITDIGETIFTTNGKVVNGDSGGPWFANGRVVGVSSQGSGEIASTHPTHPSVKKIITQDPGKYSLFQASVSTSTASVRDFVKRVHADHNKLVDS